MEPISINTENWHLYETAYNPYSRPFLRPLAVKKSHRGDRGATRFRGLEIDWTWSLDQLFFQPGHYLYGAETLALGKSRKKSQKKVIVGIGALHVLEV